MELFSENSKKIKGAANKVGDIDGTCNNRDIGSFFVSSINGLFTFIFVSKYDHRNLILTVPEILRFVVHKKMIKTRKSSGVNARGIPPAAYQVLAMLGGGVPGPRSGGVPGPRSVGGLPHPRSGGYPIPGLGGGVPIQTWSGGTLATLPPDLRWDTPLARPGTGDPPPPQCEQTDIPKYKYYLSSYYVRGR